jgi:Ion channel
MLVLLLVTGIAVWLFERRTYKARATETSIGSLFEAVYCAGVTMTTVGYGDKAPRADCGRAIAVVWMLGSLVIISLVTTSLVAQLTVSLLDSGRPVTLRQLAGMRLTAAANSSGALLLPLNFRTAGPHRLSFFESDELPRGPVAKRAVRMQRIIMLEPGEERLDDGRGVGLGMALST